MRFKIALLILFSNSLSSIAQSNIRPPEKFISEFEFFVGPTLSSLRGNLEVDNNNQNERKIKIGYTLGISLSHKLGKSFEIKSGLIFEKKGGKSHSTTTYFDEIDQAFKQGTIEFKL